MSKEQFFNPWYRKVDDPGRQEVYNRPDSVIYVYNPQPVAKVCKGREAEPVYRSARTVMMELTVRGRKDLQGLQPFVWPDDYYKELCTAWFGGQKAAGLKEMVFLCGDGTLKVASRRHECCIACWYADGRVDCFVPDVARVEGGSQPVISPAGAAGVGVRKPEFGDNGEALKEALQAMTECAANFEWWERHFRNGLAIMQQEHVAYAGQPDTFPMPEPYFKYLLAVQSTQTGSGMGSWFDLPIAGSKRTGDVTSGFLKECDDALMYAVNNC